MFHYPVYGCLEPPLQLRSVARCLGLLRIVACPENCRVPLRSVAICLKSSFTQKYSAFPASRNSFPIPLVYEGKLTDNWIPETRNRLAQRRARKPDTKAGQIWALWPEIRAALDDGQSFRSVCEWLANDAGITVSIAGLRSYVSRSRRKESALRRADREKTFLQAALATETGSPSLQNTKSANAQIPRTESSTKPRERTDKPADPMAGALRALDRARRLDIRDIHGDGDPSEKNLI